MCIITTTITVAITIIVAARAPGLPTTRPDGSGERVITSVRSVCVCVCVCVCVSLSVSLSLSLSLSELL